MIRSSRFTELPKRRKLVFEPQAFAKALTVPFDTTFNIYGMLRLSLILIVLFPMKRQEQTNHDCMTANKAITLGRTAASAPTLALITEKLIWPFAIKPTSKK
ncbi:MAG: hypothetical protein ACHQFX_14735 [Chitinophagales bacterium]